MHIVLLILKIIGAILGGLIGLALSLVLLVLFVPVRYQVNVISVGDVYAKVRVHWLLHILHLTVVYEEKKTKLKLRIFGIPFKQNKEKKERKVAKKSKKLRKQTVSREETKADANLETKKQNKTERIENTEKFEKKQLETSIKEDNNVRQTSKASDKKIDKEQLTKKINSNQKQKIHPIKKAKEIFTRIKQTISSIPQKWFNLKENIRKFLRKKDQMLNFIRAEETKYTLKKGKDNFFELIRYIGPRKLKGYIKFGTGDPCQTGQILAGASILYAYFNPKFSLYPDFEEKKLEADLEARGRLRIIRFVRIFARFYFDKQIKQCIADFKQLKEE